MHWEPNALIPLLAAILYGVLFLVVTLSRSSTQIQERRIFREYLLAMLLWSLGAFLVLLGTGGVVFEFRLMLVPALASMVALFRFAQTVLGRRWRWEVWVYLYGAAAMTILLFTNWVFVSASVQAGVLSYEFAPQAGLIVGPCYGLYIYSLIQLMRGYRTSEDPHLRNRLRYLIVGLGLVVVSSAVNFTPLGRYPIDIAGNGINALFIAYAILRHNLLDIRVVIRKGLLYSIPTVLIGTGYFLVITLALRLFNLYSGLGIFILSLIVAILTALVAQPLRDRAQSWIDRLFFREKYDSGLMLQRLSSQAASVLDLDIITNLILEETTSILHIEKAAFLLKRAESKEFILTTQKGMASNAMIRLSKNHPIALWFSNHDQLLTRHDLSVAPQFKALWGREREELERIEAELFIPLKVKGELVGIFAVGLKRSEEGFSQDDQLTLTTLANQVAVTIENARLFGSAQQQAKRQAVLLQLSTDLAVALDEQDICKRAVHNLHDMLGFDYVSVYLVDEDSGDRVLQVGRGLPDQFIPERMPPGQGLSERTLLDGQLHYTPDVTRESNYIPGNNGSEVDVPIRIGEEVKGVLIVESARLHAFSQNDCDVLNTAANLIDLALTRAELFASEHRQFEELAVLHALAMAMTEAKDVDELLERMTQLIGEKLFPDNFGILLLDETANVLHLHSTYRLGIIHKEQFSVPVGQGITGMVVKTGQPRRVADVSKDPDYISVDSRIQSEICVPLKIGGRVIGVINAESAKLNAFTVADERLLTTLAGQLAIGIERLRAVDKIYQQATTLARANALISALAQVAARIETASDLDGVLQTLGEEVKKLDLTCLVALFVPGTSDLVIRYTTLDKQRLRILERAGGHKINEFHFPADRLSPYADLTQHLHPTILQDPIALVTNVLEGFPRSVVERVLGPTGMTKDTPVGHLPLVVEERVLGLLWLWGENLKEPDLAAMSIFANQVAVAIENARLFAEVQNLAITDPLTGLYNRRGLFELGRIEFARTRRFGRPFASMMLDIDRFKRVNDTYGHPVGDQVLQALAKHCQSSVREIDLVARYGGEEFVILLPETDLEVAKQIAERLRRTIANLLIPTDRGELGVTVSLGVAMYDENTLDLETLIARADQAMYVAKHRGRNCIVISR